MFFDRSPPSTRTARTSASKTWLAPMGGIVKNESLARPKPLGAEVLDNWFPTLEGVRMRGGSDLHATIDDEAVTFMTTYEAGAITVLFATTDDAIYDITNPADPETPPAAAVSGLAGGNWSSEQMTTSGGSFLMMVNGVDNPRRFDGASWITISGIGTGAITGVTPTGLSHVWKFKSRLFFAQGGTLSAWYLAVNSIAGAATEFPLGGIFRNGGNLLFGATFSADTGEGPDDFCAFITDKGEVAIYQGTDPASASTFALVGIYKIGRPLGKNAWFKAGGDLGILTEDGVVSITLVRTKDRVGLKSSAITQPIQSLWLEAVAERFTGALPFSCALWPSRSLMLIGVPASGGQSRYSFAANAENGKWGRITGWDIRCLAVLGDACYFGTRDGTILRADETGADNGEPYSAVVIPKFEDFGQTAIALHCHMVARSSVEFEPQLFACANYTVEIPGVLSADPDTDGNVWGVAIWGQFTWGGAPEGKVQRTAWQTVSAIGETLAPGLQITSGRVTKPDIELVSLKLVYEFGEEMGSL